jgi:solute:Na+ symporter, SSS family
MTSLATIDWVLIALYLIISVAIAIRFSKESGKSLGDYFLGGRRLPWYLAGVSMVATTFAADTPLAVNELVYSGGIAGNWLWWNMLIGGMLTTFFFARLWRRADVLTEVEFITLRYGGLAARVLRVFKAVYLGLVMNILVIGWVNLAMVAILQQFFGLEESTAIWYTGAAMLLVAIYSSIGGFLSVAWTDMFQFVIAMGGCIVLAVLVLNSEEIGGMTGLKEKLGPDNPAFNFLPNLQAEVGAGGMVGITLSAFVAFFAFQWWASWYPGGEPGGGGYVAQRMMSTRSEKDAMFATLFFQIAHFCLRPWPWIIVALCTLVLYPGLPADHMRDGYVMAMRDFLPEGMRGLLLVAFLAAYMSTIATQLNWGASYLVNDVAATYLKSLGRATDGKSLINLSRIATLLLMVLGFAVTWQINSISEVWKFMIECGAGLGLVLILRWFWWRINVWSEISATVAPFVFFAISRLLPADHFLASFPNSYFFTIGGTTLTWLLVTLLTQPERPEVLQKFYDRVRPGGFWGPVLAGRPNPVSIGKTLALVTGWLLAVAMTYLLLFATGKLLFLEYADGFWMLGGALACCIGLLVVVRQFGLFDNEKVE